MGQGAAGKQPWPGCTALAVLLTQNQLFVANAGVLLCYASHIAFELAWLNMLEADKSCSPRYIESQAVDCTARPVL